MRREGEVVTSGRDGRVGGSKLATPSSSRDALGTPSLTCTDAVVMTRASSHPSHLHIHDSCTIIAPPDRYMTFTFPAEYSLPRINA